MSIGDNAGVGAAGASSGSGWRRLSGAFGVLSAASGLMLVVRPRAMGALYGLPRSVTLLRLIGVRDLLIGTTILAAPRRGGPLWARGVSDAADALLIAWQGVRRGSPWGSALRMSVALGSAGLAVAAAREAFAPSRRCGDRP